GASEAGIRLAAKTADSVFTHGATLEGTQEYYQKLKNAVHEEGRNPEEVLVFPGIYPIIGDKEEEAERKYWEIANLVSIDKALAYLRRYFDHHDFTQYDVDAPFPELGEIGANSFRSTTDNIKKYAKELNLTLREVALREATPRSPFIGTPES